MTAAGPPEEGASPRIGPGSSAEIGRINFAIARAAGAATGGRAPNIMLTLGRHRGLFRKWLRFASALMPGGRLPRPDSELLILRVAHNCGSDYERDHHERLGVAAGLTEEEVARTREGPEAAGWSPRQELLLRAADELHADRRVSDATWEGLSGMLGDEELIEVCMLVGHYEMLAMTLNSLGVALDPPPRGRPARAARVIQSVMERRSRRSGSR